MTRRGPARWPGAYVRTRIRAGAKRRRGAPDLPAGHTDPVADLLCPVVIGRGAETGALRSALAAAGDGAGAVVFLTGEAGIGKSRLARELAAEARARAVRVLTGRAVPASAASPYRPLTEALMHALRGHRFGADADLIPWLPALRAIVPAIVPADGNGNGDHSPAVRGEAVLQLLRRLAGSAGLLLVLEDLHWTDPDTLAIVEYLCDNLSAEPVLCVATCRGEPMSAAGELVARLHGRRAASRIALGRLSADDVAAMVRACLPTAADDVIARVQHLADGVPFLVEETLAAPGVPSSFADGVRARLADPSAEERLVLHTAALFGRQFDWRLLPAATALHTDVIGSALEHGVRSQLLALDGDAFRFRHMLTREAVAAELLPPRRAARGVFARHGIEPLAVRCQRLLDGPQPNHWSRLGITDRQADVLRLVAEGISNKEIAARLHLSPRTVEKHIENLLRTTAAQSRTQLVAMAGPESDSRMNAALPPPARRRGKSSSRSPRAVPAIAAARAAPRRVSRAHA